MGAAPASDVCRQPGFSGKRAPSPAISRPPCRGDSDRALRLRRSFLEFGETRRSLGSFFTRLRPYESTVSGQKEPHYLLEERGLKLKVPNARVLSCGGHLDALGHRVERAGIEPLRRSVKRLAATVARESRRARGERGAVDVRRSAAASIGSMFLA